MNTPLHSPLNGKKTKHIVLSHREQDVKVGIKIDCEATGDSKILGNWSSFHFSGLGFACVGFCWVLAVSKWKYRCLLGLHHNLCYRNSLCAWKTRWLDRKRNSLNHVSVGDLAGKPFNSSEMEQVPGNSSLKKTYQNRT